MGIKAGTRQNIGVSVKEIDAWLKAATVGEDFRAAKGLYFAQDGWRWILVLPEQVACERQTVADGPLG